MLVPPIPPSGASGASASYQAGAPQTVEGASRGLKTSLDQFTDQLSRLLSDPSLKEDTMFLQELQTTLLSLNQHTNAAKQVLDLLRN